jgi:methyl-accepting chemotaxis protein
LNGLLAARVEMSRQHDLGMIDEEIPVAHFQGAYAEMARGINTLVKSHIAVKMRVVDVVGKYAQGDLSVDMDRLPGKKALITNAIDNVKKNLQTLNKDIMALVEAAKTGRLSTRSDASKYQYSFKEMVEGINATLDAVILPVQEGVGVLGEMAKGDLTVRVASNHLGDHALLKQSINTVGENLHKAMMDVQEAVTATASASSEISSSTEEMAAGAKEQTNQTAEVASAVEEMTKTIMENSRNASETAIVAKDAKTSAEQGGKVVAETVEGMRKIADVVQKSAETVQELGRSSDQIGEIVTVIDDIADQTNLLALNAAIEAARAGEQGRGFAVVADEVRKLAERTTKATKEIAGMIKKIQQDTAGAVESMEEGTRQVADGIELADKAGMSLKEIVEISQKVTDMITQIATASEEQSSTSEQISKNVEAISAVTSETASGTQQVARAAEDLNHLTVNLQELIGQFRLSSGSPKEMQKGGGEGVVWAKERLVENG